MAMRDRRKSQDFNGRFSATGNDYSPVSSEYHDNKAVDEDEVLLFLRHIMMNIGHERADLQSKLKTRADR